MLFFAFTNVNTRKHKATTPGKIKPGMRPGFRQAAKIALIQRDLSIHALAARIGRSREAVSKAINRDRFPRIQDQIAAHLGL